jgi:hypothetical protein
MEYLTGFGLRFGERESGAEDGEKCITDRSQSATSAAEPQTEAPPLLRRECKCRP